MRRRETGGTEPDHLPLADPPAAYPTASSFTRTLWCSRGCRRRAQSSASRSARGVSRSSSKKLAPRTELRSPSP